MARKHDDAHRPMGGRGQRGSRAGIPANWGGAELVLNDLAADNAERERLDAIHRSQPVRDALLAYFDRPCDAEAREVVKTIADALGVKGLDRG